MVLLDIVILANLFKNNVEAIEGFDPVMQVGPRPVPVADCVQDSWQIMIWSILDCKDDRVDFWMLQSLADAD